MICRSQVPTPLLCGTYRKYLQELNLWIGYTGTRSVVHYDADHNIHCLLAGRKDFIMIDREYEYKLGFGRRVSSDTFLQMLFYSFPPVMQFQLLQLFLVL